MMYNNSMGSPIHNKEFDLTTGKVRPAKRIYTVWLVKDNDDRWNIYHCPDCRNPIAQYKGAAVCEIPGETPGAVPVMIQCKNTNCGRKILFKEVIEQMI